MSAQLAFKTVDCSCFLIVMIITDAALISLQAHRWLSAPYPRHRNSMWAWRPHHIWYRVTQASPLLRLPSSRVLAFLTSPQHNPPARSHPLSPLTNCISGQRAVVVSGAASCASSIAKSDVGGAWRVCAGTYRCWALKCVLFWDRASVNYGSRIILGM